MSSLFTESLKNYKDKCDTLFENGSIKEFLFELDTHKKMPEYIDALIRHSRGGKRIRAYLVYLGYCLKAGFENDDKILFPSLSFELFQTGILAHDDIIDNSDYRRFKPSMHKDLGNGHDGVSKSICVGDLGIIAAIEILQKGDFNDSAKLRVITHQNKVFSSTIAGELKDIEFSYADRANESDILDMYKLKTAQYTVSGPLVLGAILASADEEFIENLYKFGNDVGICFQIRDDILGIYGSEDEVGKSIVSDMCEGKKTVLVSHFDRTADEGTKEKFYAVYGKEASGETELALVRQLLREAGSYNYALEMCESYVKSATEVLEKMDLSDYSRELLTGLLEYMTSRKN